MAKILVSIDEKLLARLDRAARKLGLSRSAFLARLVARELGVYVALAEERGIALVTDDREVLSVAGGFARPLGSSR